MKTKQIVATLVSTVALAVGVLPGGAAVIITAVQNTGTYPVSSTDLIQTELSTVATTGFFHINGGGSGEIRLRDGVFGTPGSAGLGSAAAAGAGAGTEVIYTLDTSLNVLGYDITDVNTYASWDAGRAFQSHAVSFHLVGTGVGVFTTPIAVAYTATGAADPTSTFVSITDTSGFIANGVDQVKFAFTGATFAYYKELDVLGSATTAPEPSMVVLLGLGGLLLWRRKQAE